MSLVTNYSLVGAFLAVLGSSVAVLGLAALKYGIVYELKPNPAGRRHSRSMLLSDYYWNLSFRWQWWLGLWLYVVGKLVESSALFYASQTTVSIISNIGLIVNILVAVYVFRESFAVKPRNSEKLLSWKLFYGWDLAAIAFVFTGSVLSAILTPSPPHIDGSFDLKIAEDNFFRPEFISFLLAYVISVALLLAPLVVVDKSHSAYVHGHNEHNVGAIRIAVAAALIGAIFITVSSTAVPMLLGIISNSAEYYISSISVTFFTGLWLTTLCVQVILLTYGMSRFEALIIVPVYEVLEGVLTITMGLIYQQSYVGVSERPELCGFIIGLLLMLGGVWMINGRELNIATPDPQSYAFPEILEEHAGEGNLAEDRAVADVPLVFDGEGTSSMTAIQCQFFDIEDNPFTDYRVVKGQPQQGSANGAQARLSQGRSAIPRMIPITLRAIAREEQGSHSQNNVTQGQSSSDSYVIVPPERNLPASPINIYRIKSAQK